MIFNLSKRYINFLILPLIVFAYYNSFIVGISWDEPFVIGRGEERLKYLYSLGNHKITYDDNQYFPGLFDTLAIFFTQLFPKHYTFITLHIFNTTFSLFTLLGFYRLSKILFNKIVARISILLLYFNPLFFGHMSINSKDTIISFSFIWLLMTFLRYLKSQNDHQKRKKLIIYASLFLAIGIGTRIHFYGLIIFLSFFLILKNNIKNIYFSYKNLLIDILIVFIASYLLMVSTWPHVYSNIFIEPFKIFIEMMSIKNGPPAFLFNGIVHHPSNVPYNYFLINLLYKSPEFIIILYIGFILTLIKNYKFYKTSFYNFNLIIALTIIIILFPTIVNIFTNIRVFDGIRYFLFILPFYCLIPALTIYYLYINLKNKFNKIFLLSISILIIFYISIFIKINPYQYSFINSFLAKEKNIENKFENDYWGISLKELMYELNNYKKIDFSNKKIGICGFNHEIFLIELKKYPNLNLKPTGIYDQNQKLDFIITNNRGIYIHRNGDKPKFYMSCDEYFDGEVLISIKTNKLSLSQLKTVVHEEKKFNEHHEKRYLQID